MNKWVNEWVACPSSHMLPWLTPPVSVFPALPVSPWWAVWGTPVPPPSLLLILPTFLPCSWETQENKSCHFIFPTPADRMHPTPLWICHRSVAARGTASTKWRREDSRAAKQARRPHLFHALSLRVLLGLREAQLSHRIYKLYAFHKSFTTCPGTITSWEQKTGRKNGIKNKKPHRPLYWLLHFLKLWSLVTKSEQMLGYLAK